MQLQRLVHESVGLGTWEKTDESVPVTAVGALLGVLDISDPKHAHVARADAEMNDMLIDGGLESGPQS